jgi:hypothetical protein
MHSREQVIVDLNRRALFGVPPPTVVAGRSEGATYAYAAQERS